jgi:hypothetical protein
MRLVRVATIASAGAAVGIVQVSVKEVEAGMGRI